MKVRVFARGGETAAAARTRAAGAAVARRATDVHPAVAHLVPQTYSDGAKGWTLPYAIEREPGANGRVAILAEDDFAQGRADFVGAADKLPDDWNRSGDGVSAQPGGRT